MTFLEILVRMRLEAALKRERMPAHREQMALVLVGAVVPEVAKMIEEAVKEARYPPAHLTRNERMCVQRRKLKSAEWSRRAAMKEARARLLVTIERAGLDKLVERMGRYTMTAIAPEILLLIQEEVTKGLQTGVEVQQ